MQAEQFGAVEEAADDLGLDGLVTADQGAGDQGLALRVGRVLDQLGGYALLIRHARRAALIRHREGRSADRRAALARGSAAGAAARSGGADGRAGTKG